MDLKTLRCFVAAAEEEHFGRAAEQVHLSQPALSRQIQRLEDEMEVRLFDRSGKGVSLTHAGRVFVGYAESTLREAERGEAAARRAADGLEGMLDISFVSPAVYSNVVPALVSRFRKKAPEVKLTLHELSSVPQSEALEAGQIDIGFLHPPVPGPDIDFQTVFRQRFIAVVPEEHTLAGASAIRPDRLAGEPFVIFTRERGSGLFDRIIAVCKQHGFSPRIGQYANQMQTIVSLVATGIGVAIVPHSIQRIGREGVSYCELTGVDDQALLSAAWNRSNQNPALGSFLDVLTDHTPWSEIREPDSGAN
jgi:DNA-binding transcriptional LysR family regulator